MKADYIAVADRLAADIAAGRLQAGERLPPQRDFAYRQGIAVSTASRVYGELVRRGLVSGEVGRGTFVRVKSSPARMPLVEPTAAPIDLELIFPVLPEHGAVLAQALSEIAHAPTFAEALRPIGSGGTLAAREAATSLLSRADWRPAPESIVFTGNGRQAIAAAIASLARPGDRVGVEALTYPVVKGLAARLGITLVPLAIDDQGLVPDAITSAHRTQHLAAVYLQPSLHSPTGATMSTARRNDVVRALREANLVAVEDGVYSFLTDDTPIAALAPERVIYVDSLSKRIAPGLTLGLIAGPTELAGRLASAVRSGAWSASGLPVAAGAHWMANHRSHAIVVAKRADARARQAIAREVFQEFGIKGDSRAYHLWLPLPEPWRAETFVAAALRLGIALTPGSAFAVTPGHAPSAVRLALASPEQSVLVQALRTLRDLLLGHLETNPTE